MVLVLGELPPPDGDAAAQKVFDELYRQWRPNLVVLCRRMLGASGDAEDAVQEAFLRAWLAREQYSPARPFWPWLATIARRVCLDQRRRSGRELVGVTVIDVEVSTTPEHIVEVGDDLQILFRLLAELRPAERRTLVRRQVDGWSYHRIASVEGRTVEAVRGLLKRARASLRLSIPELFEVVPPSIVQALSPTGATEEGNVTPSAPRTLRL